MTLAAGDDGPDAMDILGLFHVAVFTTQNVIKFDAEVGIGQACPDPHPGGRFTVGECSLQARGGGDPRPLAAGHDLKLLIIARNDFLIFIMPQG